MRVKIQQFFGGKAHSWHDVGAGMAIGLIDAGHDVEIISTDGINDKYVYPGLRNNYVDNPSGNYDMQFSYTAMHNFGKYLANGEKNRFGMWAYEFDGRNVLPVGKAKFHVFADKVLVPSEYCKNIFVGSNIPAEKVEVVPHGIHLGEYDGIEPYKLKTKAACKFLLNIGQPHKRKGIDRALEAYGKSFKRGDDVCLVAKVLVGNASNMAFDVNFMDIYKRFKNKYKDHAEIELITEYVDNIGALYKSVDVVYTMTHAEGFYLPGLQAMNFGLLNIAPRHGGQLEYMDDDNSILIDTKVCRAPRDYFYWDSSSIGEMGMPSMDHAVEILKNTAENLNNLKMAKSYAIKKTAEHFTWKNAVEKMINLSL